MLSILLVATALAIGAVPAAFAQATHEHDAADAVIATGSLCPSCPVSRESTGTSWQPDASMVHGHHTTLGPWQLRVHGAAAFVAIREGGPRGDRDAFTANHLMLDVRRRIGAGELGIRSMWTLEPPIGARGYPLLLQTGETADGVTALVDRQHPHDLPMELAVTWAREVDRDRSFFLYAAAVGAPALGPPPFMHRPSGSSLPVAPITHHWFDSTHVTFGVLTAGLVTSPRVKMEVSIAGGSNGRRSIRSPRAFRSIPRRRWPCR